MNYLPDRIQSLVLYYLEYNNNATKPEIYAALSNFGCTSEEVDFALTTLPHTGSVSKINNRWILLQDWVVYSILDKLGS